MSSDLPTFTKATMQEVAASLGIACEPWMQDWPIEVADGTRLEEFIDHYENEKRPEHRLAIVEVLLVSLDDAFLRSQPSDGILARLANVFRKHSELLGDWLCTDATSEGELFAITPWLRSL